MHEVKNNFCLLFRRGGAIYTCMLTFLCPPLRTVPEEPLKEITDHGTTFMFMFVFFFLFFFFPFPSAVGLSRVLRRGVLLIA